MSEFPRLCRVTHRRTILYPENKIRINYNAIAEGEWGTSYRPPQPPFQGGERGVKGEMDSSFWRMSIENDFLSSPGQEVKNVIVGFFG
jgi:hypothetical protein